MTSSTLPGRRCFCFRFGSKPTIRLRRHHPVIIFTAASHAFRMSSCACMSPHDRPTLVTCTPLHAVPLTRLLQGDKSASQALGLTYRLLRTLCPDICIPTLCFRSAKHRRYTTHVSERRSFNHRMLSPHNALVRTRSTATATSATAKFKELTNRPPMDWNAFGRPSRLRNEFISRAASEPRGS